MQRLVWQSFSKHMPLILRKPIPNMRTILSQQLHPFTGADIANFNDERLNVAQNAVTDRQDASDHLRRHPCEDNGVVKVGLTSILPWRLNEKRDDLSGRCEKDA